MTATFWRSFAALSCPACDRMINHKIAVRCFGDSSHAGVRAAWERYRAPDRRQPEPGAERTQWTTYSRPERPVPEPRLVMGADW